MSLFQNDDSIGKAKLEKLVNNLESNGEMERLGTLLNAKLPDDFKKLIEEKCDQLILDDLLKNQTVKLEDVLEKMNQYGKDQIPETVINEMLPEIRRTIERTLDQ